MSYQDGKRVEALEAAVRALQERCDMLQGGLAAAILDVAALKRAQAQLQERLVDRPALARRRA